MKKNIFVREIPELLNGDEPFTLNDTPQSFNVRDFWRFEFSNLWDNQGYMGEFIVAMALGQKEPENCCGWTLYDMKYKGRRIEVKTTAYYQPFRGDGKVSNTRVFSIRKTHEVDYDETTPLVRNNDIYIFCLIIGKTKVEADPRKLEHWRFWVVPTTDINKECGNNQSINLNKVKKMAKNSEGLKYDELKAAIDELC